jgi:N12 class adenine-specific DNA methylase
VLNKKETTLAQQKQQAIKDAFRDWIWKDPQRRQTLVRQYNELFNSTRPREYDGSSYHFWRHEPGHYPAGTPENAIAHVLYGGNTLLAHEVGAGKTFEMAASAMEAKRLGLCQKSLFVVPNHLTEQWASSFCASIRVPSCLAPPKRTLKPITERSSALVLRRVIMMQSSWDTASLKKSPCPERQERLS